MTVQQLECMNLLEVECMLCCGVVFRSKRHFCAMHLKMLLSPQLKKSNGKETVQNLHFYHIRLYRFYYTLKLSNPKTLFDTYFIMLVEHKLESLLKAIFGNLKLKDLYKNPRCKGCILIGLYLTNLYFVFFNHFNGIHQQNYVFNYYMIYDFY